MRRRNKVLVICYTKIFVLVRYICKELVVSSIPLQPILGNIVNIGFN